MHILSFRILLLHISVAFILLLPPKKNFTSVHAQPTRICIGGGDVVLVHSTQTFTNQFTKVKEESRFGLDADPITTDCVFELQLLQKSAH